MLPNCGYFKSILCPLFSTEGHCDRPYCQFRHNGTNADKPGRNGEIAKRSTILHGAKGPRQDNLHFGGDVSSLYGDMFAFDNDVPRPTNINYSVSAKSKPKSDLEYDPMSNYNVNCKQDDSDQYLPNQDISKLQSHPAVTEEQEEDTENACELPTCDLVIDDQDYDDNDNVAEIESTVSSCGADGIASNKKSQIVCDSMSAKVEFSKTELKAETDPVEGISSNFEAKASKDINNKSSKVSGKNGEKRKYDWHNDTTGVPVKLKRLEVNLSNDDIFAKGLVHNDSGNLITKSSVKLKSILKNQYLTEENKQGECENSDQTDVKPTLLKESKSNLQDIGIREKLKGNTVGKISLKKVKSMEESSKSVLSDKRDKFTKLKKTKSLQNSSSNSDKSKAHAKLKTKNLQSSIKDMNCIQKAEPRKDLSMKTNSHKTLKKIQEKSSSKHDAINLLDSETSDDLTPKKTSVTSAGRKLLKKKKSESEQIIDLTGDKIRQVDIKKSSKAKVEKFVRKEELESLDKDLNGVNIFEECYRIYQADKDKNIDQKIAATKELKANNKSRDISAVQATEEEDVSFKKFDDHIVVQKNKRVARTDATSSAKNLREREKARKVSTPASIMMKRMELAQEKQIQKVEWSKNELASPFSKKREAHSLKKSSGLSTAAKLATRNPLLRKQDVIKQNFENDMKSASFSLHGKEEPKRPYAPRTNGTRTAHLPSNKSELERPVIMPDRHSKVPTNLRQRYLTVFIDATLKIFDGDCKRAYEMAMSEESRCHKRSSSRTVYLSLAASTVKKLRQKLQPASSSSSAGGDGDRAAQPTATKVAFKTTQQRRIAARDTAMTSQESRDQQRSRRLTESSSIHGSGEAGARFTDEEVYERLCRYVLTEDQLRSNGFPRPGDYPGLCSFHHAQSQQPANHTRKVCRRCGKEFTLTKDGKFAKDDDECIHHFGKAFMTKVGSGIERRYTCCQSPIGSEGCSFAETHVHDDNKRDCHGYVRTLTKSPTGRSPGVYALDCEMCYTVCGLELVRVSVVNFNCDVVFDTFVKPRGRVLDYNTKWSGVTQDDVIDVKTTLRDVQAIFLTKFSSDSIFLGHSLESDLVALRIIHSSVVDTSVVFPHRRGPPYKRALRNLMSENLGIVIQNADEAGHDSTEDASACVKLMTWKLLEDEKVSR